MVSNVAQAARQLGVDYPIAIDDDYATWNAYENQYWPAEYLIDATGQVRHVDFGEGQYGQTESFIRHLLATANPGVVLPPRTDVAEHHAHRADHPGVVPRLPASRRTWPGRPSRRTRWPSTRRRRPIPQDEYAYNGHWSIGSESSTAGPGAAIRLNFEAQDVYLVLGGTGTVTVSVNGSPTRTVAVSGEPKLYQLVGPGDAGAGTPGPGRLPGRPGLRLHLRLTRGVPESAMRRGGMPALADKSGPGRTLCLPSDVVPGETGGTAVPDRDRERLEHMARRGLESASRRIPRSRWLVAGALGALVLVAAACSSGSSSPTTTHASTAGTSRPATVALAHVGSFGNVLVGATGLTIYHYTPDGTGMSVCTGGCATLWPPVLVAAGTGPVAGSGLTGGNLGTITRADGTTQVTYKGMPLYTHAGDKKAGEATGQNVGGTWFVVTTFTSGSTASGAGGATATTKAPGGATTTTKASGGYGY